MKKLIIFSADLGAGIETGFVLYSDPSIL